MNVFTLFPLMYFGLAKTGDSAAMGDRLEIGEDKFQLEADPSTKGES